MIIPWRVDVPQERWPFSNWLIIIGVVIAFVFQMMSVMEQKAKIPDKIKEFENYSVEEVAKEIGVDEQQLKKIKQSVDETYDKVNFSFPIKNSLAEFKERIIKRTMLQKYFVWSKVKPFVLDGCKIKGLFGHIWLHGGLIHLLGNLLFLWIFGNAVCAKIGNFVYLPIYLVFGLLAAVVHLIFVGGPMIGASGAINGIVGMYLVFYPENEITCFWSLYLFYWRQFSVRSFWMILLWLVYDILGAMFFSNSTGGVAYFAHFGGFAAGFGLAILILKMKWIVMERYEKSLLQMWEGRKEPVSELYGANGGMFPYNFETQKLETAVNTEQEKLKKTVEVEKIPFELEEPKDEFIRFMCACGKKVKAPVKYAGKIARCPRCQSRVRIPEK